VAIKLVISEPLQLEIGTSSALQCAKPFSALLPGATAPLGSGSGRLLDLLNPNGPQRWPQPQATASLQ